MFEFIVNHNKNKESVVVVLVLLKLHFDILDLRHGRFDSPFQRHFGGRLFGGPKILRRARGPGIDHCSKAAERGETDGSFVEVLRLKVAGGGVFEG